MATFRATNALVLRLFTNRTYFHKEIIYRPEYIASFPVPDRPLQARLSMSFHYLRDFKQGIAQTLPLELCALVLS